MSLKIIPFISLYALAHLAVDAACAYLLLGVLDLTSNALLSMLIYNAAAFVFQAPAGLLIDKILNPKLAAMTGLTFVAISFLFWNNIYVALIIVGIGNALYHVGGGSLVLSLKERKATFSGIYVAPGAVGLAIGSFLAASGISLNLMAFPVLLLFLSAMIYHVATPDFQRAYERPAATNFSYGIFIIILIMIPIVVRSLIGLSIEFPWKQNQHLLYTLVAALVLGKVVGGILADKYGLMKAGVGGLLFSVPFLAFHSGLPVLGIAGAFIFNLTMPVTLIAILNVLPQYKGLSFGLTTVALFIGALPSILNHNAWLRNSLTVLSLILLASAMLFLALRSMKKPVKAEALTHEL
jgi:FSR family fosmidomycin resistance protein-like MFS transporter